MNIAQFQELLDNALHPIQVQLGQVNQRLDHIDQRIDNIDRRLDQIDQRLVLVQNQNKILMVKEKNSLKGRSEPIERVPLGTGDMPACEYPVCIAALLVAGNEALPNGEPNNWNADKSRILLQQYDPGYETDETESQEKRSRTRRLKVARVLGITKMQLNFAQMDL